MEDLSILRDLFDDKIIKVINIFIKNPDKQFYLSEISKLSKVNVSTTFRIVNKLVAQGFIKVVVLGRVKLFNLERNEKTNALFKLLNKEEHNGAEEFLSKLRDHPRIKRIIEEVKNDRRANYLIVGDYIPTERLDRVINDIKTKYNFNITYATISESQFDALKNFKSYKLSGRVLYEKKD